VILSRRQGGASRDAGQHKAGSFSTAGPASRGYTVVEVVAKDGGKLVLTQHFTVQ
jgi:hypothetical protein